MKRPVFNEADFDNTPGEMQNRADRSVYTVQYKKLFETPDGNLAVARRVGWDTKAGGSHKYSIIHIPTRTDLGIMFHNESAAREFIDEVSKEWDWSFNTMSDAPIEQEKLFRVAGKLNGLNFLGQPIFPNIEKM